MIKHILGIILLVIGCSLVAQEAPLKDFAESKKTKKYAFYPSTLRMINVSQNEAVNELVSGVDKLLIYSLDSITRANKSYTQVTEAYLKLGYEEYASAYGGGNALSILSNGDTKDTAYVGFLGQGDFLFMFYLKGDIAWQKIPSLIEVFQNDTFFDSSILDLY